MSSHTSTPAASLAFLSEAYNTRAPSLFLITGPSGSGKTKWCQKAVEHARQHQWPVAGLLAPPVIENGQKIGIDLLDLSSSERRRLATLRADCDGHGNGGQPPEAGVSTGAWNFYYDVLAWGNGVLKETTRADFVIVDELGPLEFRQRQGLQAGLELLDAWRYRLACVTIRPSLVGAVRMRWPWSRLVILDSLWQPASYD
ncbi:MAG: nucleoside-triphosphatase [Candidatus Promineifilaceae bacterium]|nr:nucleoside-triphosphatase [Candidatus Promineifilaceae bacterium]